MYKGLLVVVNFGIVITMLFVLAEHLKLQNSAKSWSLVFYLLSCIWLLFRGIFWFLTIISTRLWGVFQFFLLYWVPVSFQFASYLVVPLFFFQILFPKEWRSYRAYVAPSYFLITVGIISFMIIWSFVISIEMGRKMAKCNQYSEQDNPCFNMEFSSATFHFTTGICFLILAFLQGLTGLQINKLSEWQRQSILTDNISKMTGVNIVLFTLFFTRSLYEFSALFKKALIHIPNFSLQGREDISLFGFIITLLWDYVPTILLLVTVASNPTGSRRSRSNSYQLVIVDDEEDNTSPNKNFGIFSSSLFQISDLSSKKKKGEKTSLLRSLPRPRKDNVELESTGDLTLLESQSKFVPTKLPPPQHSWFANSRPVDGSKYWLHNSGNPIKLARYGSTATECLGTVAESYLQPSLEEPTILDSLTLERSTSKYSAYAPSLTNSNSIEFGETKIPINTNLLSFHQSSQPSSLSSSASTMVIEFNSRSTKPSNPFVLSRK